MPHPLGAASRQYQHYLQTHRAGAKGLNLKDWGRVLGWVCLGGSLIFWVPTSWKVSEPIDTLATALIATAFGCFMAFGPPVLVSIFVPGTRAGRLLLKLNALTPGKVVALGVGLFLMYHAYWLLHLWWSQRAAATMGIDIQMAILGVIFTIIAPALLFEPLSRAELHEELETAHQTQMYEIASRARINMYLKGQQEAESLMAQGLHNLNTRQLRVVAGYISGFAQAVDETHRAWAAEVKDATGRALPYRSIGADPRTIELLSFLDQLMSVQAGFDLDQSQAQLDQYLARSLEASPTQRLTPLPAPAVVASTAVVGSMEPSMDRSGPQRSAAEGSMVPTIARPGAVVASMEGVEASMEGVEGSMEEESRLYGSAREALGTVVWTRQQLEQVLDIKRSKASALIADWRTRGLVVEDAGARFHYYFVQK